VHETPVKHQISITACERKPAWKEELLESSERTDHCVRQIYEQNRAQQE